MSKPNTMDDLDDLITQAIDEDADGNLFISRTKLRPLLTAKLQEVEQRGEINLAKAALRRYHKHGVAHTIEFLKLNAAPSKPIVIQKASLKGGDV